MPNSFYFAKNRYNQYMIYKIRWVYIINIDFLLVCFKVLKLYIIISIAILLNTTFTNLNVSINYNKNKKKQYLFFLFFYLILIITNSLKFLSIYTENEATNAILNARLSEETKQMTNLLNTVKTKHKSKTTKSYLSAKKKFPATKFIPWF